MDKDFLDHLETETAALREGGLFKDERVIASSQQAVIRLADGSQVVNLCANNYLGLSGHPAMAGAAAEALDRYGFGMSSVRFICGTQTVHKELESRLAGFLGTEDAILYSSCFDANGGLFETLLDERDAVISDALNHASIIDGIRLSKARRLRYANNDMADLERKLGEAAESRFKLIATDGVFSMDGILAELPAICDLADRFGAMVMVDDSHAVGCVGPGGRGTPAHFGVAERIDIVTGTLGKALGGASGGYTAARRQVVEWLRQRSRPYLFSNSLAPMIAAATLKALDMLAGSDQPRRRLEDNSRRFRAAMEGLGFTLAGAGHPIIPVMLGDAVLATEMAGRLLGEGVYAVGFSFPVVPRGQARIRAQMSAAHEPEHVERAVAAFAKVGRDLGVIT